MDKAIQRFFQNHNDVVPPESARKIEASSRARKTDVSPRPRKVRRVQAPVDLCHKQPDGFHLLGAVEHTLDEQREAWRVLFMFAGGVCCSHLISDAGEQFFKNATADYDENKSGDLLGAAMARRSRAEAVVASYATMDKICHNYDSCTVFVDSEWSLRDLLADINEGSGGTGLTNTFVLRTGGSFFVVCTVENHDGKLALQHVLEAGNYSSAFMWMCVPARVWDGEILLSHEVQVNHIIDKPVCYMNHATQVGLNTIRFMQKTAASLSTRHGTMVHLHISGRMEGAGAMVCGIDAFLAGLSGADPVGTWSPDHDVFAYIDNVPFPSSVANSSTNSSNSTAPPDLSDSVEQSPYCDLPELDTVSSMDLSALLHNITSDKVLGSGSEGGPWSDGGIVSGSEGVLCSEDGSLSGYDTHAFETGVPASPSEDLLGLFA